jgi:DNA-3-methyladenine glycosylase
MRAIQRSFYERDSGIVAKNLLGKVLVRRLDYKILSGKIVETEAYYGGNDPASRAHKGKRPYNQLMFMEAGKAFIYTVHANWLLNIVAHSEGEVGAVLIRAIEPLHGIETMQKNRRVERTRDLTSGPGKLTKTLAITKELNGLDVTKEDAQLMIIEGEKELFSVSSSHRIGVKADLPQKLRFFVEQNKFVSRNFFG